MEYSTRERIKKYLRHFFMPDKREKGLMDCFSEKTYKGTMKVFAAMEPVVNISGIKKQIADWLYME